MEVREEKHQVLFQPAISVTSWANNWTQQKKMFNAVGLTTLFKVCLRTEL